MTDHETPLVYYQEILAELSSCPRPLKIRELQWRIRERCGYVLERLQISQSLYNQSKSGHCYRVPGKGWTVQRGLDHPALRSGWKRPASSHGFNDILAVRLNRGPWELVWWNEEACVLAAGGAGQSPYFDVVPGLSSIEWPWAEGFAPSADDWSAIAIVPVEEPNFVGSDESRAEVVAGRPRVGKRKARRQRARQARRQQRLASKKGP